MSAGGDFGLQTASRGESLRAGGGSGRDDGVRKTRADGPLPGRAFFGSRLQPVPEGYVEEEWLVSGEAPSFAHVGDSGADGRWAAGARDTAPYVTRVVVRRPVDPVESNGTLLVEWMNVTSGADVPVDWLYAHRHIVRTRATWIGVSAQRVGLEGGGRYEGRHLRKADPERYRTLAHPGDGYSYGIFADVAAAALTDKFGPLAVETVLAMGHSQSAARLVTYINAIDPIHEIFHGYLVHGRPGVPAPLPPSEEVIAIKDHAVLARERSARVREDVRVPVIIVQSETDLCMLGSAHAHDSDADHVRIWEVAGSAHSDTYLASSTFDRADTPPQELLNLLRPTTQPFGPAMPFNRPINSGPQQHYVIQAALRALDGWARGDAAPVKATAITLSAGEIARDATGIAKGGIRTGWVDAPVETLSGEGQSGDSFDVLYGTTAPIAPDVLSLMYPRGERDFLERFDLSTVRAAEEGYLLEEDVAQVLALGRLGWQRQRWS